MNSRRRYVYTAILLVGGTATWFLCVNVIGAWFVRALYQNELPFAAAVISGAQPLEHYQHMLTTLAWSVYPAIVLSVLLALWADRPGIAIVLLVALAVSVRVPSIFSRAVWGDESYTLIQTAGHAPPEWPSSPSPVSAVKYIYTGSPTFHEITATLREIDVHPPLYYWAVSTWRQVFGFSIETTRLFSLVCAIGSILAVYFLLRAARLPNPIIPTLIYAMSAYGVYFGGVARNYAMGLLWITVASLLAYRAVESVPVDRRRATVFALGAAVACGAAFQTHYFALFVIGAILVWLTWNLWRHARWVAVGAPVLALSICLIDVSSLLFKLGARPRQQSGFLGVAKSIEAIAAADVHLFWQPIIPVTAFDLPALLIGLVLILATVWLVRTHARNGNRRLWALLFLQAAAPTVAIFLIDLTGQNVHNPQYFLFATPALATILAYPLAVLYSTRRPWGLGALALVWALQMACINWGLETGPSLSSERKIRSAAKAIQASLSPSQLVVIDRGCSDVGAGCGFQHAGAFVYELDPRTTFLTYGDDSDPYELESVISRYKDVWLSVAVTGLNRTPGDGSHDGIVPLPPTDVRKRLMASLRASGCYRMELFPGVDPELYHLLPVDAPCRRQVPPSAANQVEWP